MARNAPSALDLVAHVAFERQGTADDGYGGTTTIWMAQFDIRAHVLHLRGGESVQAARLSGQHVQIIRVRSSPAVRGVTTDWRILDLRPGGAVFNIRDIEPSDDRKWIDFLCQKGVAT